MEKLNDFLMETVSNCSKCKDCAYRFNTSVVISLLNVSATIFLSLTKNLNLTSFPFSVTILSKGEGKHPKPERT